MYAIAIVACRSRVLYFFMYVVFALRGENDIHKVKSPGSAYILNSNFELFILNS